MRDTRLPFTVLLPDDPAVPIEIHDHSVSLQMAVAAKDSISKLDSTWDAPGVYVLLDAPDAEGNYAVYVGKAPAGIRQRLAQHERTRQWSKALVIRRDNQFGLNSAHVGWLEGDLYELFDAAERARLHNSVRPGDKTVASYDIRILESFRDPIARVLRLIGYDPSSADESVSINSAVGAPAIVDRVTARARYAATLAEIINSGILDGNEPLISVNAVWPATAQLQPNGTIEVEGRSYPSPSAAAVAVKGSAVNGWDFWAVEQEVGSKRLATYRREFLDLLAVDDDA